MSIGAPSKPEFARERMELEAVLASGIFGKSSGIAQLLSYICEKYFEGSAHEIKEYNIGVEALGRSPEFDQKKDSIVRVEAHRLRRRLREYYEGDGAGHSVQIVLPAGQYVPQFVLKETAPPATDALAAVAQPALAAAVQSSPKKQGSWILAAAMGGLIFCSLVAYASLHNRQTHTQKIGVLAASDFANPPNLAPVRIRVGSTEPLVDRFGHQWDTDRFFEGGLNLESHQPITLTQNQKLYQSRREGAFRYDIPLKPGTYEMRLHFAETVYGQNNAGGGGESSRVFNVLANGTRIVQELDIVADAGPNAADVRAFKDISPAADGKLHITFEQYSNPPILSGIELLPGTPGRMRPIRMVAQDRTYTDSQGQTWEPDSSAIGGRLVDRAENVLGAVDQELYKGERYGNIQYSIPVPAGQYGIALHFSEAWFGPDNPGRGGAGSRTFDILCNGVALRRSMDIFQEAGGAYRAYTFTAHGLVPNQQGKLVISLLPLKNYASINALEVFDEAR